MKGVGDFLSKFNKLAPPNDALRRAVIDAIRIVINAPLTKAQIKIHNGTAFIDVSSILKNKIRMHRREILDTIYEKIPKAQEQLRDIR